jgi:hypothetical protein
MDYHELAGPSPAAPGRVLNLNPALDALKARFNAAGFRHLT